MTAHEDEPEQEDNADDIDEAEGEAESVGEFADDEAEVSLGDFEEDGEDSEDAEIDAVVELSGKEQSARALEIRRAIEERRERRQIAEDLDYLDFDEDD